METILRSSNSHFAMGDLTETFNYLIERKGILRAGIWFRLEVIYALPGFIKNTVSWGIIMFLNYIKIAFRNFRKNFGYTLLNISGLAVGLTCSILIMLYVNYERSYDSHNIKADRIYRFAVKAKIGGTRIDQTHTPAILTPYLLTEYPEVEYSVRFSNYARGVVVEAGDKKFNERRVTLADGDVFNIFSFSFLAGDPANALQNPNSAVITDVTAERYFGNNDPLGKTIFFDGENYEITGVIKEMPENSHFHFDILASINTYPDYIASTHWTMNNFTTYILLKEGVTRESVEAKFPDIVKNHVFKGYNYDEMVDENNFWEYYLQPLGEIHLTSDLNGEFEANGNENYVVIFTIIAFFIILIAVINYMNLSTARSAGRSKEVGVRKVVGSFRFDLIKQFLTESILSSTISVLAALLIVQLMLPAFREFTGREALAIPYFEDPLIIPGLLLLSLIIGILSGLYPAFFLSSFRPITVLTNKNSSSNRHSILRNTLVLVQFSISIFLLIGTIVVWRQLNFLQDSKLGYDKEHVVVLKNTKFLGNESKAFKKSLTNNPSIISVCGSSSLPGFGFNNWGFAAGEEKENITLNIYFGDYEFLNTLKFEMKEGRYFSEEFGTDTSGIIINEATVKLMGWENPLGKIFNNGSGPMPVIGVVKDFHYESLHYDIRPGALLLLGDHTHMSERYISVRITPGNIAEKIEYINESWNKYANGIPFEYSFLDEDFNRLYKNEAQTGRIFLIFSILAIFIACLGLFGMTAFMAELKTKEIGIRKVLGSSVANIVLLLSKEFTRWVIIANLIAWPVSYILMKSWLEDFAYRISIEWWFFILSGMIVLAISILTVIHLALKAAVANPVDSLRNE